jgi:hypothetical protein
MAKPPVGKIIRDSMSGRYTDKSPEWREKLLKERLCRIRGEF